jgi:hypothetical protein
LISAWWLAGAAVVLTILPCRGSEDRVLWQAPGIVTMRDWIWGVGGEARAPQPPFEFGTEDLHGTNPKVRVRDAKGRRWIVKFGGESHGDVIAFRLLHAMGYVTTPRLLSGAKFVFW